MYWDDLTGAARSGMIAGRGWWRTFLAADLQKLNHTHEEIARWLLANPGRTLKECAEYIGYRREYISAIVNNDLFREYYSKLSGDANQLIVVGVKERLDAAADAAMEKLSEMIEDVETTGQGGRRDRQFVLDAADVLLTKAGFGNKHAGQPAQPSQPTPLIYAEKVVVTQALERAAERFAPRETIVEAGHNV